MNYYNELDKDATGCQQCPCSASSELPTDTENTMEIIKEGQIPGEKEHTGTCTNCRCQVRFKEKEAQYRSFPKNESAWVVKCPTKGCGREIYVDASWA